MWFISIDWWANSNLNPVKTECIVHKKSFPLTKVIFFQFNCRVSSVCTYCNVEEMRV